MSSVYQLREEYMKQRKQNDAWPYQTRGTGNKRAKLTEQEVLEIRRLHATGKWGYRRLSNRFPQVGMTNIRNIVKGISWKHLLPKEQ